MPHIRANGRALHVLLAAALVACRILPAVAAIAAEAAADPHKPPQLSDAALFQLLYREPNNCLQALGNVRAQRWGGGGGATAGLANTVPHQQCTFHCLPLN